MWSMSHVVEPIGTRAPREPVPVRLSRRDFALFAALPVVFTVVMLTWGRLDGLLAYDLVHFELPAAQKLVDGESPYPGYGYPPLVAFALVPLVAVPAVDVVATLLLVACVPAILWLLGVRDWRCYGLAFLWAPVFHAVQTANVTLPMMLLLALAWRYREAAYRPGVFVGAATAAKILAWPAGLWLLATRRIRGWLAACVTAFVLVFGLWAILGFDGLFGYSDRVQSYGASQADLSYTIAVLFDDLGAPRSLGRVVAVAVAVAILALCAWMGLRGRDRESFALAAAACIYASPVNWLHSFAFLLLVVAVMRPRLSAAWFVPLPMLLVTGTGNGQPWQTGLALGLGLVTVIVALLPAPLGALQSVVRGRNRDVALPG
jgi:Glycosyltransferase family 87